MTHPKVALTPVPSWKWISLAAELGKFKLVGSGHKIIADIIVSPAAVEWLVLQEGEGKIEGDLSLALLSHHGFECDHLVLHWLHGAHDFFNRSQVANDIDQGD
jgi:hypothetical protein